MVCCDGCGQWWHTKCVSMEEGQESGAWRCPGGCKGKKKEEEEGGVVKMEEGEGEGGVVKMEEVEEKEGEAKTVSFFAKRARGAMARFVMENQIEDPNDLRGFNLDGYAFSAGRSDDARMIFTRPYPEKKAA